MKSVYKVRNTHDTSQFRRRKILAPHEAFGFFLTIKIIMGYFLLSRRPKFKKEWISQPLDKKKYLKHNLMLFIYLL